MFKTKHVKNDKKKRKRDFVDMKAFSIMMYSAFKKCVCNFVCSQMAGGLLFIIANGILKMYEEKICPLQSIVLNDQSLNRISNLFISLLSLNLLKMDQENNM